MGLGLRLGEDNGMMCLKKKIKEHIITLIFLLLSRTLRLKPENNGLTDIINEC